MTWPNTTPISTANVDSGLDNPALARVQIQTSIENINAVVAEFSNVGISSAADTQVLQYMANTSQWNNRYPELHRYTERTYDHGTTSGNVVINYNNGNVQKLTANGNVNFSFTNFPTTGTVSVVLRHQTTPAVATFPATVLAAGNDRFLSTDSNVSDIIHISTVGTASTHYVTIVRGFE